MGGRGDTPQNSLPPHVLRRNRFMTGGDLGGSGAFLQKWTEHTFPENGHRSTTTINADEMDCAA